MREVTPENLIAGIKEFAEYKAGRVTLESVEISVPDIDVREIRENLGVSQDIFAERYGLSVRTVRNWERGIRKPEGPARVLLNLIARKPDLVAEEVSNVREANRMHAV